VIQIEVAHARLDEAGGVVLIDLEDAIHPLEVHHDAPGVRGRGAAVSQIAARGDRVERNAVLVGDADDLLDLLHLGWRDRRGSPALFGLSEKG